MISVLFIMFLLIGAGFLWGRYNPARMDSAVIRKVLADMVYSIFLPTLVLNVLWRGDIGLQSVQIAGAASFGVLMSLMITAAVFRFVSIDNKTLGAVLLASSFPNATYLGYPMLTRVLGDWAGPVAIQYDLFACTPLLLTLGIYISARLGGGAVRNPLLLLIKVPPLWAALAGSLFNIAGIAQPSFLSDFLGLTSGVVVPVMLFVIGLALADKRRTTGNFVLLLPISLIQLFVMPLTVLTVTRIFTFPVDISTALVLEGSMPCMALGIVICDKYGLNSSLYAMAVTVTTVLSLVTIPSWHHFVLL